MTPLIPYAMFNQQGGSSEELQLKEEMVDWNHRPREHSTQEQSLGCIYETCNISVIESKTVATEISDPSTFDFIIKNGIRKLADEKTYP